VVVGARSTKIASAASRRSGELALAGLLAATLAVQIWVGITVARSTLPPLIPAVLVASCGLLLPLAGSAVASLPTKKAEPRTSGAVVLGGVTLAVVGFVWVAGGTTGFLVVEGVILACCVVATLLASSRPSASHRWRVVLAPVPSLVARAMLLIVPSAPALRFRLEDESAASRLMSMLEPDLHGPCISEPNLPALKDYGRPVSVCGEPGSWLVIRMRAGHDSLGLATSYSAFEDECVRHLDRNWWALAEPTPDCRFGYHFVLGP
jgi:hypothetical protein